MAGLLAGSDVRYDVGDDHRPVRVAWFRTWCSTMAAASSELLRAARPVLLDLTGGLAMTHDRVDVVRGSMTDASGRGDADPSGRLRRMGGRLDLGADRRARLATALSRWCGAEAALTSA